MDKFFDYLEPDLPLTTIRELLRYIIRLVGAIGGDTPVEGKMGSLGFCASRSGEDVRVHWVQVGRQRIPVDAAV